MHLGCLRPPREAEEAAGQAGAVFCAGSQEKKAVVVATEDSVATQHSSSGSVVCPNAEVGVTKCSQLVRLRHSRQEGVKAEGVGQAEAVSCEGSQTKEVVAVVTANSVVDPELPSGQ
nr:unnamed protein product [Spirometra erinaceieuropaei]